MSPTDVLRRHGPVAALVAIRRAVHDPAPRPRPVDATLVEPVDPWRWTSVTQQLPVIVYR